MLQFAKLPYVGAVGAKLYYPDSTKLQHCGITNLPIGPVHKLQTFEDHQEYYDHRNQYNYNCIAVTAACLLISKDKFLEVNKFDEELKIAYNDVDLGFKLYEQGYHNVVVNEAFAYHHESLSRGDDERREKQARLQCERNLLYQKHKHLLGYDPYYPYVLNHDGLDNRIVPGYYTANNTIQKPSWQPFAYWCEKAKEDPCLMVRVESCGPDIMRGYCIVLGDNNACYDKYLVLVPIVNSRKSLEPLYMKLDPQYRDDLEANLPDQENVAMCGFCIDRNLEGIPQGTYKIGALVSNRITRMKLIYFSGRYLEVLATEDGKD